MSIYGVTVGAWLTLTSLDGFMISPVWVIASKHHVALAETANSAMAALTANLPVILVPSRQRLNKLFFIWGSPFWFLFRLNISFICVNKPSFTINPAGRGSGGAPGEAPNGLSASATLANGDR